MKGSLQEKHGKYYAVFRVNGKQMWESTNIPVQRGNKRKAEQVMRQILAAYETNENVELLFTDYLQRWVEQIKPLVKPVTWETYDKVINNKILPYFKPKKYKLYDLTSIMFTEYFIYLKEHGRSNGKGGLGRKSVTDIKTILSSALQYAVENNMLDKNVIDNSRLPLFDDKPFQPQIYTPEQIKTLLKYAEQTNSKAKLFLFLEMSTGARKGELMALSWEDVNFEKDTIYICHNITGSKKEVLEQVTSPKTKNGYRTIPIPPKVVDMLKKEKELQDYNRKLFKSDYFEYPYDYVIRQENGRIYNPNSINRIIRRMTDKLGLPPCRVHDYRHAVASTLFESGVPLADVTTQLGHGQTSTTEKIYIHKSNTAKKDNMKAIAKAFDM